MSLSFSCLLSYYFLPKKRAGFCYNGHMNEKVFRVTSSQLYPCKQSVIYDLINTKEFQRLRRIKQLGTSSYSMVGHSRFSHCLGSMRLHDASQRVFEENISKEWDPAEPSWPWPPVRSFMTSGMVPNPYSLNISLIQIMRPYPEIIQKVLRQRSTKSCCTRSSLKGG